MRPERFELPTYCSGGNFMPHDGMQWYDSVAKESDVYRRSPVAT